MNISLTIQREHPVTGKPVDIVVLCECEGEFHPGCFAGPPDSWEPDDSCFEVLSVEADDDDPAWKGAIELTRKEEASLEKLFFSAEPDFPEPCFDFPEDPCF